MSNLSVLREQIMDNAAHLFPTHKAFKIIVGAQFKGTSGIPPSYYATLYANEDGDWNHTIVDNTETLADSLEAAYQDLLESLCHMVDLKRTNGSDDARCEACARDKF